MSKLAVDYTIRITDDMTYRDVALEIQDVIPVTILQGCDEVSISLNTEETGASPIGSPIVTLKKKGSEDVLIKFDGYPLYDQCIFMLSGMFRKDRLQKTIDSQS
jgi:hypothetical protein